MRHMGADLKDLSAIHKQAAEMVASEARTRAPVLSGTLAGSIRARGTQTRGYVVVGGKRIPYAGPIHFGWPRHSISPQPFIYDALDERKDEVIARYDQLVEALVEKVGRETPP
jgi:hypothetical protein